ncbi:hypothetical protein CgunFtcFv8_023945 [Champsocephalus gunnari]|uniref:Uncharacterized protein n=1 Tax=Champsocephalus gunnari TaxID=52237 RepID=A0AAN8DDD0_CHAGU|nr:hypothetical protein CgunFtcFv8_023945 [Champsocephalus gunnari]
MGGLMGVMWSPCVAGAQLARRAAVRTRRQGVGPPPGRGHVRRGAAPARRAGVCLAALRLGAGASGAAAVAQRRALGACAAPPPGRGGDARAQPGWPRRAGASRRRLGRGGVAARPPGQPRRAGGHRAACLGGGGVRAIRAAASRWSRRPRPVRGCRGGEPGASARRRSAGLSASAAAGGGLSAAALWRRRSRALAAGMCGVRPGRAVALAPPLLRLGAGMSGLVGCSRASRHVYRAASFSLSGASICLSGPLTFRGEVRQVFR